MQCLLQLQKGRQALLHVPGLGTDTHLASLLSRWMVLADQGPPHRVMSAACDGSPGPALALPLLKGMRKSQGVQLRPFAGQEGFIQMTLQHIRKEKNLLTPLKHQTSGASHQPPPKQEGYISTKHSQGTEAKPIGSLALASPLPISMEHSREWMRTEDKLVDKHYSEAIYYGVNK